MILNVNNKEYNNTMILIKSAEIYKFYFKKSRKYMEQKNKYSY